MAIEILDSRCRQDGPDVSWSASHAAASTSPERYAVMGQFGSPRVLKPKTRKTANMGAESHQRYCVPAWVVFQGLWATMAAAQATNQTTSSSRDGSHSTIVYLARIPAPTVSPRRGQAHHDCRKTARWPSTSAQLQQQVYGASMVMSEAPAATTGSVEAIATTARANLSR